MSALPSRPTTAMFERSPTVRGAYDKIKRCEERLVGLRDNSENTKTRLIDVRILGYFILHWPKTEAVLSVATAVATCDDDDKLYLQGKLYRDHIFRLFTALRKGCTPVYSTSSRSSFERESLTEPPDSHDTAKVMALERDGYCCPISGLFDTKSYEAGLCEVPEEDIGKRRLVGNTQCCHIISQSINKNLSDSDKSVFASTVWAILKAFGYKTIDEELNGVKIHRLENILTLNIDVHSAFDSLQIWLEATNVPNTYKVQGQTPVLISGYPKTITFQNHAKIKRSLPSPVYLEIHASCAKVAHLSGAAEYIERITRDFEKMKVLAEDGSSAILLDNALSMLVSVTRQEF
ncbi:hypothetical protein BDQ17DRAFT_1420670 [Cyathus striatus]|nr:hypothetical protein BDQ17DRAFT_1420670 [Cyathus striatus]